MTNDWPFEDSPDIACFTTRSVLVREKPIQVVLHDDEDDCWHFLCSERSDALDARVISLRELLKIAPEVAELADLLPGWTAVRDASATGWKRFPTDDRTW